MPPAECMEIPLFGLLFSELEQRLEADGVRPFHARAIWAALFREPAAWSKLELPAKRWLSRHFPADDHEEGPSLPSLADVQNSSDGFTKKYLLNLADGQQVETVHMAYPSRETICISTQAGCAMGCVFCATGQGGFARHLKAEEIVTQVVLARRLAGPAGRGSGITNLVAMGMGEPLHNYEAVMRSLEILSDSRGIGLGTRKITISTVGVVPGILRLAEERRPWHLAVSLHAATDEERGRLIPVAKKWPLTMLIDACRVYANRTGRKIFFEWTLIAGVNDSPDTARTLSKLIAGLPAHVNLIPLNPTRGYDGVDPGEIRANEFQAVLRASGIPSTVRERRGIDVAAGCGQLKAKG